MNFLYKKNKNHQQFVCVCVCVYLLVILSSIFMYYLSFLIRNTWISIFFFNESFDCRGQDILIITVANIRQNKIRDISATMGKIRHLH